MSSSLVKAWIAERIRKLAEHPTARLQHGADGSLRFSYTLIMG